MARKFVWVLSTRCYVKNELSGQSVFKKYISSIVQIKKKIRNLKDMPEKMNELQVNVGSILEELKKKTIRREESY